MTKEEAKQYLRNQINSCIKIQSKYLNECFLYHNKNYLRALKLSKINGKPINKDDFKGGEDLFWINTKYKTFWYYPKIEDYLEENYSIDYTEQCDIVKEVINEYDQYKDYNVYC